MASDNAEWWRGCVIYQIYPRSFQDTTGDGSGDLRGVASRLVHVASLGVDAVWLSPFFKSPMADMGYDVSDYTAVDPMFGTSEDFDAVVAEAHRLGLKLIIDQVLSHSSDRHEWFVESRTSRDNPRADWYVWADPRPDGTAPNNWLSVFGGPAWEWDATRRQYCMHNFLASQPDLNFHNPEVQDALLETVRFWLERGVDGFRLDTVNYYVHDRWLRSNPPLASSVAGTIPKPIPTSIRSICSTRRSPKTSLSSSVFGRCSTNMRAAPPSVRLATKPARCRRSPPIPAAATSSTCATHSTCLDRNSRPHTCADASKRSRVLSPTAGSAGRFPTTMSFAM
ncbi:hypothetical protein BQ8482_111703 [Mesorhizobium delmotii]|uniref:Glycosyl hydrolase family 13 catalytic domain-containing protein n=1 Tax=Mesorhizobium delmotii TaxID=1631247 RepID=A0A2P9AF69_9HYPH|nr:hypothetical protein BQ8482_111703 [Mesorhizobium delmotii]